MGQRSRREKIEAMLAESPEDSFLIYGLALECLKEGDDEEAIRQLKKVLEMDPDYQAAYFQLGQHFAQEGDNEQARGFLEEGIQAARRIGNTHAVEEMTQFLETLS